MAWRDWLSLAVVAACALVLAFSIGHATGEDIPDCPTEDSCTVDYRDGGWHITRD